MDDLFAEAGPAGVQHARTATDGDVSLVARRDPGLVTTRMAPVIPRIFHQIWVGPNPMPEEFRRYQKTWRDHHPSWEFRFWMEETIPTDLRRQEVYERLRVPAERADILRLELLYRFGGIYLDTDFECRTAIEPYLDDIEFFTAYLKPGGRVNNAIIGSTPGHPILDRALNELRPREYHGYDKAAAGPVFFDRLIAEHPEVKIFDAALFYPATPSNASMRSRSTTRREAGRTQKDFGRPLLPRRSG